MNTEKGFASTTIDALNAMSQNLAILQEGIPRYAQSMRELEDENHSLRARCASLESQVMEFARQEEKTQQEALQNIIYLFAGEDDDDDPEPESFSKIMGA